MIPNPFDPRYKRVFVLSLILYAVLAAWGVSTVLRYVREIPPIESLTSYTPSLVTRFYDVNGELVSELFIERRSVLSLSEIPVDMQRAVLAIEDDEFYRHVGINFKAIVRASIANLRARRTRQGGSTITQQLAKNIFLTRERTIDRKIKELLLTLQMERNFSKDEILQLYMNQIYFGHGAYGVQAAAKIFFGKNASELNLAECALLAGLPKAPQSYSPFKHPERALARRNTVLRRMRELGFITEQEESQTSGKPIKMLREPDAPAVASYFVEQVRLELEPAYGSDMLYRGGFSIYTTLDLRMQKAAEESLASHLTAFDDRFAEDRMKNLIKAGKLTEADLAKWKKWKDTPMDKRQPPEWDQPEPAPVQGALVAIDPKTGGVRAMVGGRDFQKSQFNRATQARRQPGSTFKPFVWLAALESGFTAATVVSDYPIAYTDVTTHPKLIAEATDYNQLLEIATTYIQPDLPPDAINPVWVPKNWDDKFLGDITLRKAIALSRNLVSVRLTDRVGPRSVADMAHRAGIESPLDPVLSLGLGSSVVTILEMVSAFGTIANSGVHMVPYLVQKVLDNEGRLLQEHIEQGRMALTPQSSYLITNLLEGVIQNGTGRFARNLGRPAGGKTGTTQGMRDVWFIGFVPDLAAGVWIGHDDFMPLGEKITSAGTSVPWWTDFMSDACKYIPARDFTPPPGILFAKIDADTGYLALPSCPHVVLEAFREAQVPRDFCPVDHEAEIEAEVEITE
jgi:penicillin-binding protein 1A